MTDYTNRTWSSLSQLKEKIEKDGKEKIVEFNGLELVTNKFIYGLYAGVLVRTDIPKKTKKKT